MIQTILWDVDNTLLDFNASERAAMWKLFSEFALVECSEALLARYSVINDGFWQRLERGELCKAEILPGRFAQFFAEYGIDPGLAGAFNERYQLAIADTVVFRDKSLELVKSLRGRVRQYAVSNGTVAAQTRKLERSGLDRLLDGVFLSEQLGVEKPNPAFFDKLFAQIGPEARSTALIVGDSLTSDMQGGLNAGIKTCWYNPERKPLPAAYPVDFVISDLWEILTVLPPRRMVGRS